MLSSTEIKQALRAAGFEVFQTQGGAVHVAERVRENLILDSGIRVRCDGPVVVIHARAQRSDFPGEAPEQLFRRARDLAGAAVERGYAEAAAHVSDVTDPSDPAAVIDSWYQVTYEKTVPNVPAMLDEVRFALGIERTARRAA
ncbi:MAG: hypothetical protein IT373_03495 [Polyangiaceae bacterium]|nr:hypothetical protein [Polyangiaceae bacterium]